MVCQLGNDCLPREILQMTFKNLVSKKEDIKACMLVCKSWSFVARGFFCSDVSVAVTIDKASNLLNDLPLFSQKVTAINFKRGNESYSTAKEDSVSLQKIVVMCPNLVSLTLDYSEPEHLLNNLNSSVVKLDKIQKIHLLNSGLLCGNALISHLELNLKYCRTITTLDISLLHWFASCGGVKKDDLNSLIAKFPNLKHCKASYKYADAAVANVNLKQLLNAVPQLETLKLYNMNEITTHSQDKDVKKDDLQGSKLTTLKLTAAKIDIKSMKFITSNLRNIDRLDFIVKSVTPDAKLTKEESHKILKAFKLYALKMKRLVTEYSYRNRTFSKEINKMETTDHNSDGYEETDEDGCGWDEEEEEDEGFDVEEFLLDMELRRRYRRCAYADDDF